MANKQQDVVKDIRSAVRLEQELQVSYTQKGVVVVDVYSAEWGPCKAINETFRRLATDQLDGVPLRFISAECHSIIAAAKANDERNHQRPKNIEAVRETLPEAWLGVLEERAGLSKPYFVLYKEGKRISAIEGVNTPQIRAAVKDLCAVKVPASDSITNASLLDAWEENFPPTESEVQFEKFHKAMYGICALSEPLNDEEIKAVLEALHIKPESKDKVVLAENLQKWVGDEDGSTLTTAFHALLPDYKARAAEAQAERAAEEQRAAEEKNAKEQESHAAEVAQAAAKAKAEKEANEKRLVELNSEISHLVDSANGPNARCVVDAKKAIDTEASIAQRGLISKLDTGDSRSYSHTISFFSEDEAREKSGQLAKAFGDAGTFTSYLVSNGMETLEIENLRTATDNYFRSSGLLSAGKFAVLAASSTIEDCNKLFHVDVDLYEELCNNTLSTSKPALAKALYAVGATSVTDFEELHFVGPSSNITGFTHLEAGQEVVLNALSLLDDVPRPAADGDVTIVFRGIPRGVSLQKNSVRKLAQVASSWFLTFDVESNEDGKVVLNFKDNYSEDALDTQAIAKEQDDDDDAINGLYKLRKAANERAELVKNGVAGADEERAPTPEKPATPVVENRAATPVEEKPATPVEERAPTPVEEKPATPVVENRAATPVEEKPATPEDKPATPVEEKPATPVEEKPATPAAEEGEEEL
jgi:hypothetical protein